jgi:hypothetical protein
LSRKNVLDYRLVSSQSLAATFTSDPTVIQFLDSVCYQINVTTTNSQGTFSVEGSLDYVPANTPSQGQPANDGNWAALHLTGTPSVSAANDTILIDLNQLPYKAIRLKYTSSVAGTGTCSIYLNARQLGG